MRCSETFTAILRAKTGVEGPPANPRILLVEELVFTDDVYCAVIDSLSTEALATNPENAQSKTTNSNRDLTIDRETAASTGSKKKRLQFARRNVLILIKTLDFLIGINVLNNKPTVANYRNL